MTFDRALAAVLEHEGGYVNHPDDPGGETKYGISRRAYPNLDIAGLTPQAAAALYRRDYWDRCRCDELPGPLALVVFDCAVNQGVARAITTLQRTLHVGADGVLGPVTLQAARLADDAVVARYLAERAMHYAGLPNFATFGRGWMRRLFRIAQESSA